MSEPQFDPVKRSEAGKKAMHVKWSTAALEKALEGLDQGAKLIANPFYENNTHLLKGDLVFTRTKEEIQEWVKCSKDIIYFANKYCKLMTPQGIQHIELRDYQVRYLQHLMKNRLSIFLSCRQSGKTTTSAIFMLHYILFNVDKNALVLGNKRKTAVEILDKVKKIYLELPFFLKPGVYKWNESEIAFDNGCRCMAEATTINSGISFTFHCVLADEFAHIAPNIKEQFYNNLFPTITAAKARFMITSTQNGVELFARLYTASQNGENEYAWFEVNWPDVPEWDPDRQCWYKRDEAWHQQQVGNLGGEEAFQKQFGCSFISSSNALINSRILNTQKIKCVMFKPSVEISCSCDNHFYWHPDYDLKQLIHDWFIITVDIAEGRGGDYTVFTFNKMLPSPVEDEVRFEAVGQFRCNEKDIKECAVALCEFCNKYLNPMQYLINIEYNTYGALFSKYMCEYMDKYDPQNITRDNIIKYYNESKTKFTYGIKVTHTNKQKACTLFKSMYEKGDVVNNSLIFFNELQNFVDVNGNGVYRASFGHDDTVMSQINLILAMESVQYRMLADEFCAGHTFGIEHDVDDISFASIYDSMGTDATFGRYQAVQDVRRLTGGMGTIYDF